MFDNGVLEYYLAKKQGKEQIKEEYVKSAVSKIITPEGIFYKKFCGKMNDQLCKADMDAEILLSQLYNKLGIKSAVYIPMQLNDDMYLLSDNVETDECQKNNRFLPFLSKFSQSRFTQDDHYMQQLIKLMALDTASGVVDRAYNFFDIIEKGKARDIRVFDSETSGQSFLFNNSPILGDFKTIFCPYELFRDEVLDELKNNKILGEITDKNKLSEAMGSANIRGVAQDITENIGYEIDEKYVDYLLRGFEEVAQALE